MSWTSFFRNFRKFGIEQFPKFPNFFQTFPNFSQLFQTFSEQFQTFWPKNRVFWLKNRYLLDFKFYLVFFEIFKIDTQFWLISKLFSELKFSNLFLNFFAKILRVWKFHFFQKISKLWQPNISETHEKFLSNAGPYQFRGRHCTLIAIKYCTNMCTGDPSAACKATCQSDPNCLESTYRYQFHQHLTCSFFANIFCQQNFKPTREKLQKAVL